MSDVLPPHRQVMLAYALNNLAFDFKRALNCAALSNSAAATAALGKPGCAPSPSQRAPAARCNPQAQPAVCDSS